MLLGFDATTIRGNKSGVGYYTSRLVEHLTAEGGASNPIDELLILLNRLVKLERGVVKLHFKDHGVELTRKFESLRARESDPAESYSELPHVGSA